MTSQDVSGAEAAGFDRLEQLPVWRKLISAISRKPHLAVMALLLAVAGGVLVVGIVSTRGIPKRDSGIFLYIAQLILEGKIPYRDAWDNKPPGIFYADALGLLVGRGSLAGLWLVEMVSIGAATLFSFKALARAFGPGAAFFGSMTWLIVAGQFFVTDGLNLTEEYALPFKFAALWLFLECEEHGYDWWRGVLLGATAVATFLFRQNLVGIHLAIAAYILFTRGYHRQVARLVAEWAWLLAGALAMLVPVCVYFAANSALRDLIDVAVIYNLLYSTTSVQSRLGSTISGFDWFSSSGTGVIAIASWIAGLVLLVGDRTARVDDRRMVGLAVIAFPMELLLAGTSSREYGHYYQAWLPVAAVLAGFLASRLICVVPASTGAARLRSVTWLVALMAGMAVMPAYSVLAEVLPGDRTARVIDNASDWVKENTRPGDYVLVWGADPGINFLSGRKSPTRFIHQYPLLTPGYETPAMAAQFLADLKARPPAVILDTSPLNGHVPPINDGLRAEGDWQRWGPDDIYGTSSGTDELFGYINRNYVERGALRQFGSTIYIYGLRQGSER